MPSGMVKKGDIPSGKEQLRRLIELYEQLNQEMESLLGRTRVLHRRVLRAIDEEKIRKISSFISKYS